MGIIIIYAKCQKKVNLSVKCVCTIKKSVKNSRLLSDTTKEVYSLEMFATDLVFFKEIRAPLSVSIVKLSLKDHFLNIFKLLESYIYIFLILEAIKITVVECKTSFVRESSVMCNALWEQFKMVNDRKTITFFKMSHKLSHRELLY